MKYFVVRFFVDPHEEIQWMLTTAASREQAITRITDYMQEKGINIRVESAYMDQSHYVRRVGRPSRKRREEEAR